MLQLLENDISTQRFPTFIQYIRLEKLKKKKKKPYTNIKLNVWLTAPKGATCQLDQNELTDGSTTG